MSTPLDTPIVPPAEFARVNPPHRWRHIARDGLLVLLLALTLNLVGNGRVSLWDRDEPRYAGCTREMRASGDYIHPTFNGEPRYHKPILIYWLMLAGTALGGDNPFGARLVSVITGALTCLLTWVVGRRMFGARAGLAAGLVLATAPIFFYNSKLATTDATLALFLTGCLFSIWELSQRDTPWAAASFWVCMALATLTKGPIGPVLLVFIAGLNLWWGGPNTYWRRLRWRWGIPLYLLITLPWYIAIGVISHGEFYKVSMGYHVLRRMTNGIETHGGFPGYYVSLSAVVFYPWSALLPAALIAVWSRRKGNRTFSYILAWIVGPLLFLEIVRTKLIHYYLPGYVGCALAVGWLLAELSHSEVNLRRWPLGRISLGMLSGIGIAVTVSLLAAVMVVPGDLKWPCLAIALVLGPATLYAMERFQAGASVRAASALVVSWSVVLTLLAGWLLPAIQPYRLTPLVAQRLAETAAQNDAAPILAGYKPPGIVYEMRRILPMMSDRDSLAAQAKAEGTLVAALSNAEIQLLKRDERLELEPRGTVHGYDVEHARPETLQVVLIRPAASAPAVAASARQERTVE